MSPATPSSLSGGTLRVPRWSSQAPHHGLLRTYVEASRLYISATSELNTLIKVLPHQTGDHVLMLVLVTGDRSARVSALGCCTARKRAPSLGRAPGWVPSNPVLFPSSYTHRGFSITLCLTLTQDKICHGRPYQGTKKPRQHSPWDPSDTSTTIR